MIYTYYYTYIPIWHSQPYTRQHNRQQDDLTDQRAKSFLHLCDMLRVMDGNTLPKIIVLENVIGFESVSSF